MEQVRAAWNELPLRCPHCGNRGHHADVWTRNAGVPFKLVEDVVRSFEFTASLDADGRLAIVADTDSDSVDWESGHKQRLECMACFGDFPLPNDTDVDYE